jgi:translation initiation factor IF-2
MRDVTVKQFAEVVGVPADRLLVQLGEAGMDVSDENATITESQKTQLLDFLRESGRAWPGAWRAFREKDRHRRSP